MKKKKYRLAALFLSLVALCSFVFGASAAYMGDIDGDGKVSSRDARLALRASAKIEKLTRQQIRIGDLNGTGRVGSGDARTILRMAAGLETLIEIEASGEEITTASATETPTIPTMPPTEAPTGTTAPDTTAAPTEAPTMPTLPQTTAPVTNAPADDEAQQAFERFVNGILEKHYKLAGYMVVGSERTPLSMICSGNDIRMSSSFEGKSIDIAIVNDKIYLINNDARSYMILN